MATLILGSVGRALGGSLGGLIGTVVGGSIDQGIFGGGRTREGPRVANLAVQSAAYGEPLPRLYGRMRVAGNLVWTAGIRETRSRIGGGKRGPTTNSYSYSSSFAVIVAARKIVGIARIWADGKLLRSGDGGLIFPATIRAYLGDERQGVDPLIAAAEGIGAAPAYRDRAYVVFEDLPLADYGNRIPNLTFEVVADDADISVDTVACDVAGVTGSGSGPLLHGFAAGGAGSIRQTLTQLVGLADLVVRDSDAGLVVGPSAAATVIAADALGASETRSGPLLQATRHADSAVPDAIVLGFSDPARDFQPGQQRAVRRTPVLSSETHELPVALAAAAGKQLAETMLRRAIARRTTAMLALPWRYATLRPGDAVRVDGDPDPWRIRRIVITGAVVECEVERTASRPRGVARAVDSGRVYAPGDAPQGPTVLHVLDLPSLDGLATVPRLLLAAAGASAGWRRADVIASRDGGHTYTALTTIDGAATVGAAATTLSAGISDRWDRVSVVEVDLIGDAMTLDSASEAAVLAGANLALVGDEILQFARAEQVAPKRFRLSVLLRGRRGTEAAVAGHAIGERFILLDDRLATVDLPVDAVGAALSIKAIGPGEDAVVVARVDIVPTGAALRPLSPVQLTVTVEANGNRRIGWIRRSRAGFAWIDGADTPLGEEAERYRVTVTVDGVVARTIDLPGPSWTYPAAAFAADAAAAAASLTIGVAQLSATVGAGPPATFALDIAR